MNTNVLVNSDCIVPVQQCTGFHKKAIYAQIRYLGTSTKKARPSVRLYNCLWHPLLSWEKILTLLSLQGEPLLERGLPTRALPARCAPAPQGEQVAVYRDYFEPRDGFLGLTPLLTATSTPSTVEEALSRRCTPTLPALYNPSRRWPARPMSRESLRIQLPCIFSILGEPRFAAGRGAVVSNDNEETHLFDRNVLAHAEGNESATAGNET